MWHTISTSTVRIIYAYVCMHTLVLYTCIFIMLTEEFVPIIGERFLCVRIENSSCYHKYLFVGAVDSRFLCHTDCHIRLPDHYVDMWTHAYICIHTWWPTMDTNPYLVPQHHQNLQWMYHLLSASLL